MSTHPSHPSHPSRPSRASQPSRESRRLKAAALTAGAALAAGTAVASPADAAPRWPKHTVTYRNVSPWSGSVDQAVSWINAMPGRVQLRRATSGRRADITVRAVDRPSVDWAGQAEWWAYGTRITTATVRLNADWFQGDGATMPTARAEVAAHEFIHALGVPHLQGCTLMDASGVSLLEPPCSDGIPEGEVRCGPQRRDAQAIVARYGGSIGSFDGFLCADESVDPDDDSEGDWDEEG